MQPFMFAVELRRRGRYEMAVGRQPAAGSNDKVAHAPFDRIDHHALECSDGFVARTHHDRSAEPADRSIDVFGVDVAKGGIQLLHVSPRSNQRARSASAAAGGNYRMPS